MFSNRATKRNPPIHAKAGETWEVLKARYPFALTRVWVVAEMDPGKDRPGIHQENVFDCPNGARLIVSRDRHPDGEYLHISGSIWDDDVAAVVTSPTGRIVTIKEAIRQLTGETVNEPVVVSVGGIPHWAIRLE